MHSVVLRRPTLTRPTVMMPSLATQPGTSTRPTGMMRFLATPRGATIQLAASVLSLAIRPATSNIGLGFNAGSKLTTCSHNIDIGNEGVAWRERHHPHRY